MTAAGTGLRLLANRPTQDGTGDAHRLLGGSPLMAETVRTLERLGPTDAHVLITGESGTGKELAARTLHRASGRTGPFVALNCGALTSELLASQLFGHERGSFTGAVARHPGVFEQAEGGTLFLDEIGDMPLELQVFLLRVLEQGEVVRVGGETALASSARIVAATNRPPTDAVQEGKLRADLFYRLADITVRMPSLRERPEDIVLLAQEFVQELNCRFGTQKSLTPAAEQRLQAHPWPGNVRELRSAIRQSFLLQDGPALEVEVQQDLPEPPPTQEGQMVFQVGTPLEVVKREVLVQTLRHCNNDKTAAARLLGVSVRTVHNALTRARPRRA